MKLLLMALITSLLGCSSAPGPLGVETIDISDFDFSTPIATILPESYKSPELGEGWYYIPLTESDETNMLFRQPIESWESDEVLWIEYQQSSETSQDEYLRFEGQILNTAYFMTDPEEKIMIAGGSAKKISKADSRALIERITKKYGKPEHKRASFPVNTISIPGHSKTARSSTP